MFRPFPFALALACLLLIPFPAGADERGKIVDRNGAVLAEDDMKLRRYPQKELSGHVVGYCARNAPGDDKKIGDLFLW